MIAESPCGHSKDATLMMVSARPDPLLNPLPQAGEEANEKDNLESSGEGTTGRCANLSLHLADENATIALAQRLAARLKPGMVIYLRGDLGAGKTTLVRGVLSVLGYAGRVKSPTYTLAEPYQAAGLDFRHFDLYRMLGEEEWEAAGFRDGFDGRNIFFIEWPEKAQRLTPKADIEIMLEISPQGRNAKIHANTEMGKRCLEKL